MDEATIHERRWWTLVVLCLSLVMVILGNTVLNVALPTLVRELHASSTQLQWMVDAYALVFAGLLLTGGALGDRFGRKGALTIGLVIFGLASLGATQATSATHLVIARGVMGIGAALVMPATLSILTNVFPPHERARAIAIWAGLAGAGAAIGPIAGGWLLEHFYWGSIFYLNVPVVLLALLGGRLLVPTSRDPDHAALDPIGAGLSIVGLGALLYAIIEAGGARYGWDDPIILVTGGGGIAVLVAFGLWELHSRHPMLDLHFFRDPRFSAASTAICLTFFAMFGNFFVLTQYLQFVHGYTALEAGIRTLPMAMTMMVAAPSSARLVERFGGKRVVATGLTTIAIGMGFLSTMNVDSSYAMLAVGLVIMATGMGLTMAPSTASIMSSLPLGKAGVGSAVNDTTRELGGALGVAVLGSLLASGYESSLHSSLAGLSTDQAAQATASLGDAIRVGSSGQLAGSAGADLIAAAKSAFVDGMGLTLSVGAIVALVGAVLVARYLPGRAPAHAPAPAPTSEAAVA